MENIWSAKRFHRVSLVTPCMGRLCHLKETIIKNIENNRTYPKFEYVLLDYNSPDGLEAWAKTHLRRYIESGHLNYYKTTEPKFFHMSHAKNVGHLLATGDIVANVDADNFVGVGYAEHLNDMMSENRKSFCRCGRSGDNGTGGRIAVWRKDFIRLGGYDERMLGWGYEDADFALRCRRHHLSAAFTNSYWCKAIQHDDASRERYHTPPNRTTILRKAESIAKNRAMFDEARHAREMYGNREHNWGAARVMKNFRVPMTVGSDLLIPADRQGNATYLPQPAMDVEEALPNDPILPQFEPVPAEKPKTVGFFSVSSSLRLRAVPFPNGTSSGKAKRKER